MASVVLAGIVQRDVLVEPVSVAADVSANVRTTVQKTIELTSRRKLPVRLVSDQVFDGELMPSTVTAEQASDSSMKVHLFIQCDGEEDVDGMLVLKLQVGEKVEDETYNVPFDTRVRDTTRAEQSACRRVLTGP